MSRVISAVLWCCLNQNVFCRLHAWPICAHIIGTFASSVFLHQSFHCTCSVSDYTAWIALKTGSLRSAGVLIPTHCNTHPSTCLCRTPKWISIDTGRIVVIAVWAEIADNRKMFMITHSASASTKTSAIAAAFPGSPLARPSPILNHHHHRLRPTMRPRTSIRAHVNSVVTVAVANLIVNSDTAVAQTPCFRRWLFLWVVALRMRQGLLMVWRLCRACLLCRNSTEL